MLTNGPGDRGSNPGRIIPKTQKIVLDADFLNIQHYKVQIKGRAIPGKGVAPSPTSQCGSYRKGSLRDLFHANILVRNPFKHYFKQIYFTHTWNSYKYDHTKWARATKGWLYTLQTSRTEASQLDVV